MVNQHPKLLPRFCRSPVSLAIGKGKGNFLTAFAVRLCDAIGGVMLCTAIRANPRPPNFSEIDFIRIIQTSHIPLILKLAEFFRPTWFSFHCGAKKTAIPFCFSA